MRTLTITYSDEDVALLCVTEKGFFSRQAVKIFIGEKAEKLYKELTQIKLEKDAIETITELPEQTEWIPVTERLPENEEWVLATFKNRFGSFVTIMRHSEDINAFEDSEYIQYDIDEVIAWMPLPKPYKAGE